MSESSSKALNIHSFPKVLQLRLKSYKKYKLDANISNFVFGTNNSPNWLIMHNYHLKGQEDIEIKLLKMPLLSDYQCPVGMLDSC